MNLMVGLFSKTKRLYDALGDERRLSILILLRAKKEMNLEDIGSCLGEESKEILEPQLNILENSKLIQKSGSAYSLTAEGIRRLSELGVTESEASELAKERETLKDLASQDQVFPMVIDNKITYALAYPIEREHPALFVKSTDADSADD